MLRVILFPLLGNHKTYLTANLRSNKELLEERKRQQEFVEHFRSYFKGISENLSIMKENAKPAWQKVKYTLAKWYSII